MLDSPSSAGARSIPLSALPRGQVAIVAALSGDLASDPVSQRLYELGFEAGARVCFTHGGPFGGDPIAVKVGNMTVALRRAEAARVQVML
jgi:ferrous iron transport protein A